MAKWLLLGFALQLSAMADSPTICVDAWRGDSGLKATAEDAISSALLATGKFRLTENCAKANYVVRGSIVERADLRSRSESESAGLGSVGAYVSSHGAGISGSSQGSSEALTNTETKRQVTLTVKLVSSEGAVLLALSQDSTSSKSKSAFVEATEKVAKEIVRKLYPADPVSMPGDKSGYVKIR